MPTFLTHLHLNRNFQSIAFNFVCASPSTWVPVHGCAFASQFMRTCDFLRYICSKVSIWWAGLDLVASNKLLFQCCLCSGRHHRQLCGWPPVPPQGELYIWLVWLTSYTALRHGATEWSAELSGCKTALNYKRGVFGWTLNFKKLIYVNIMFLTDCTWWTVWDSLWTSLCTLWRHKNSWALS